VEIKKGSPKVPVPLRLEEAVQVLAVAGSKEAVVKPLAIRPRETNLATLLRIFFIGPPNLLERF
jgi:hypothetical protein